MTDSVWAMEQPARAVADKLWSEGAQLLPAEILRLDESTAAIVVDVNGVDYILTMQRVPQQRPRPLSN